MSMEAKIVNIRKLNKGLYKVNMWVNFSGNLSDFKRSLKQSNIRFYNLRNMK